MPAFRGPDPARKFHCDVPGCSASFVKRAHLRRHEMTHTQRRDFSCPGCSRAFSRNDSMARHLRRKHPHLYRSPESTIATATGVERLYSGSASSVPSSSTSAAANYPTSSYSMLSLRSPFDSGVNSPVQRRSDEQRLLPDPMARPSGFNDVYGRDGVPHSPKGVSSAHWRAGGSTRESDTAFLAPSAQTDDGTRTHQGRFGVALKDEPDSQSQIGAPTFYSNAPESMNRAGPARRPYTSNQATTLYRSDWMQTPNLEHETGQAQDQMRFPWERHEAQAAYVHPGASTYWPGAEDSTTGSASQSFDPNRRDVARTGYVDPGFSAAVPSGMPSLAPLPYDADPANQPDMLQSEFFVGALRARNDNEGWANLDPCMLAVPTAERVRVEAALEPGQHCGQHCVDATLAPPGSSVSPSAHSTAAAAAETYFAVDLRNLSEQGAPAAPPNAGQVEQIMAELGIDFGPNQASASGAPHAFASQTSFAEPGAAMASAPLIPSQAPMPPSWTAEQFGSSAPSFHQHSLSQAQSSQSSVYLPSLSASQTEYLGPNATSHRRPMDRVWSTASMAFDSQSQPRAPQGSTQGFTADFDEGFGKHAETSNVKQESQASAAGEPRPNPNFTKPHDLFPSQRAARDEEGGTKSARNDDHQHQANSFSNVQHSAASNSQDVDMDPSRPTVENGDDSTMPSTTLMGPPRQDHVHFTATNDKSDMEVEEPPLPVDAKQRNSSASASTSAVSGDQLQLVVDRFRVFAQLCQDHMHPSAEMLECLAPLIPSVVRADAPFYHPKMIGSQKTHSAEEAFALLSLASLQSSDLHLKEEGHRLICFLYGLVMLSYKHTLHLGGKLQSFLNCLILVGVYGMRQHTPDLWQKYEQNRESILLDVLKAETRSQGLDTAMDCIETDDLHTLEEEQLLKLWSQWYEHESRKRTLLFGAILDSQSSCYFSPFKLDLSARAEGPRCQFLFAHVHEPCADKVFFAWPPKAWASRLATSASLPSAKGAKIASQDGKLASIAASLAEQLLRPHVAHHAGAAGHPRFRSSFDFGSCKGGGEGSKLLRSDGDQSQPARAADAAPFVEVAETAGMSARSSRRPSGEGTQEAERAEWSTAAEARVVPQLYMSALLEAVNGAWMTDSGWYQTPAWGPTAMAEQLEIDAKDFDVESASLAHLPGWRTGRTLHATQVAHALMNWSEMFSGWKDGCHTRGNDAAAELGLKVTDDAHHLTIRWQAIFLGLCTPLPSLCFYLDTSKRSSEVDKGRHERISLLLKKWVDSSHCRRALVHAGTILTLHCAAKTRCKKERPGPSTSHAVYMALVVLVCTSMILSEQRQFARHANATSEHSCEELIPTKEAWSSLLESCDGGKKGKATDTTEHDDAAGPSTISQDWLRVRFWHRKFQFLGLAGIFRGHEQEERYEVYADWRASVSAGAGVSTASTLRRPPLSRPRWSSFAGEARWTEARRETIHVQHHAGSSSNGGGGGGVDHRRSSHAHALAPQQDADRDLLRRHLRTTLASNGTGTGTNNASTETRRWILQGNTHQATFCGLAFWSSNASADAQPGSTREQSDAAQVFGRDRLRELVMWVREDNPAWCFSQEYTSLLLGALQEDWVAEGKASSSSTNSHDNQGCAV
ncbi:Cys(2)His(2) zinc finger transcriptional activator [Sporisorium reilianum f. sp. reilianum]|uniref:Cys(2)His(2) zinc finger transcriptional activator n=1 Tax=Sporisorium reilianum f. sp. reilianum TaxID=72559 RepID=A0A2N8UM77_9BASI|nr:Cys(2)His(2) zinc finger transcriptional activator [Sporisorium reilianum f. sp. reilianum]